MSIFDNNYQFFERLKHNPTRMPSTHYHDKHELYILLKGNTKYIVGDNLFNLLPKDLVFIPKGIFHASDSIGSVPVERVLLTFDDDFIDEKFSLYYNFLKNSMYARIKAEQFHKIESILNKMEKESAHPYPGSDEMLKLYTHQLLILIYRFAHRSANQSQDNFFPIIQNAIKYISDNLDQDLSLDALSKRFSISAHYFSKRFKQATGIGLNEYINTAKISKAEHLLLTTNLSITDISLECGFNDSSYFASVFKRLKGVTPKKYSMTYKK